MSLRAERPIAGQYIVVFKPGLRTTVLTRLTLFEQVLAIEARMALEGVRIIDLKPAEGLKPLVAKLS